MPRKTKVIEVPEQEIEANEPEEVEETEVEGPQEIEEAKPAIKPKRILTEKQLENLKRAREAALLKKKELKELAQKAKALPKKEIEVKAAEYDKLEEKKKQILEAPKTIKRSTKKVEEDEEEEETKPIKKVTVNKNNNNSLEENVSMLSIQQKLKLERQKMLMSALTPMC